MRGLCLGADLDAAPAAGDQRNEFAVAARVDTQGSLPSWEVVSKDVVDLLT